MHVYSILAAIKYHFQNTCKSWVNFDVTVRSCIYIYTASIKNAQIFFKNTIHTMIDPYKDKIWSTNGKNSYFDFLFLKKLPLSLVISGIRKKISSTTLLRHVVFRGVGRGLWFWINFLWIPVRILKGPMRRVRVHSSWQNDYFIYINN